MGRPTGTDFIWRGEDACLHGRFLYVTAIFSRVSLTVEIPTPLLKYRK